MIAEQLKIVIEAAVEGAIKNLERYQGSIRNTKSSTASLLREADKVGRNLTRYVTLPMLAAGGAAVKLASDMEKQKVAFEVFLGSAERAGELFEQIRQFAARTPFELPDLVQGAQNLMAFGTASGSVVAKLEQLGNLARGDSAVLQRLVEAYGKLQAKGRASLEEINRFTEAGVPLMRALAEQTGVTTQELFKLIEGGKIGFREVEAAVASLTTGAGQFANMTARQAETFSGKWSTMVDNVKMLAASFGEVLLPALKGAVEWVSRVSERFAALSPSSKSAILAFVGIAAAAGPAIKVVTLLIKALQGLTTAGVVGLAIVGVAALAAGLVVLVDRWKQSLRTVTPLADELTRLVDVMDDLSLAQAQTRLGDMGNEMSRLGSQVNQLEGQLALLDNQIRRGSSQQYVIEALKLQREALAADLQTLRDQRKKLEEAYEQQVAKVRGFQKPPSVDPPPGLGKWMEILQGLEARLAAIDTTTTLFGTQTLEVLEQKVDAVTDAIIDLAQAGATVEQILGTGLPAKLKELQAALDAARPELTLGVTTEAPDFGMTEEDLELYRRTLEEYRALHLTLRGALGEIWTDFWKVEYPKTVEEAVERTKESLQTIAEMSMRTFAMITEAMDAQAEARIRKMEEELEAYVETAGAQIEFARSAGQDTLALEDELEAQRAAREADLEQARRELEKKQFQRQKALDLAEAVSAGAVAFVQALKAGPIIGPILASAIAGLTAAQIGIIAAQKYPGFARGGEFETSGPTTFVAGEGTRRERVRIDPMPDNRPPTGGEEITVNFYGNIYGPEGADEFLLGVERGIRQLQAQGRI